MYRADAHFRMGTSHEAEGSPCQDYALAKNDIPLPFAVVSDGCSTSGRTDIGARLWCLAMTEAIKYKSGFFDIFAKNITEIASGDVDNTATVLGLDHIDLDATLGAVFATRDGATRAILFGDGIIAAMTPRGLDYFIVEWAGNMPGYPSYLLNEARRLAFVKQSEKFACEEDRWPCEVRRIRPATDNLNPFITGIGAASGLGNGIEITFSDADIVMVMTDGAAQISGLHVHEAVSELMAIGPARQGAFARRKLNATLKRWAKDGHRPTDDIAIAALVRVEPDV